MFRSVYLCEAPPHSEIDALALPIEYRCYRVRLVDHAHEVGSFQNPFQNIQGLRSLDRLFTDVGNNDTVGAGKIIDSSSCVSRLSCSRTRVLRYSFSLRRYAYFRSKLRQVPIYWLGVSDQTAPRLVAS